MAFYTLVVQTDDGLTQDEVLEQFEQVPAVVTVAFMGPDVLIDEDAIYSGTRDRGGAG